MPYTSTLGRTLQFSHTSSTEYTSSAAQSSNWLTEVFSSASDIEEPDVKIHADETSPLSSTSEATSSPGGKAGVCISFVNVTGAPTKDGRSQARKIATAARKKERQVRLRRHKREAVLIAGSGLTDDIVACTTEGILPIEHYNTFKIPAISRFSASRSDPFIKYPLELSHGERKLLDHIFYEECGTIRPYKEAFFPLGLNDVAAFHQVLANLTTQLDAHRYPGYKIAEYERKEAMAHHVKALAIIHQRLSDPKQAISQGTLGTVIAMACFSHLTRDFKAWHTHINGLQRLLRLQRDLQTSDEFSTLSFGFNGLDSMLGPALSWVDANGSASQDITPRFPLSPYAAITPPCLLKKQGTQYATSLSEGLTKAFTSGATIFNLLKDAAIFAEVFNSELRARSLLQIGQDATWGWTYLYPLAHNTLSYRNNVDLSEYASVVIETCRLGLSMFVTQMRRQFGIAPLVLSVYADKLLCLLQNSYFPNDWGKFEVLKLWTLVVGAMEVRGGVRAGLLKLLVNVISRLGIKNHAELEKSVRKFIWVEEVDRGRFWELELELWRLEDETEGISDT